jgi:putative endonuclease
MERCQSPACRQAGVYRERSMFYVYFLKSEKDGHLYIGRTNNLERRLNEHNSGHVSATKSRRPFVMLGYETYDTEAGSVIGEKEWKKGFKREELKKRYNII